MYFHSITTACVFIFIFASIEFIFATIAWKGFGEGLWQKLSLLMSPPEEEVEQEQDIASTSEKSSSD